jgi:hypothetical protein
MRAYPVVTQNRPSRRADERSVIRRMNGPHSAEGAEFMPFRVLFRPTKANAAMGALNHFG